MIKTEQHRGARGSSRGVGLPSLLMVAAAVLWLGACGPEPAPLKKAAQPSPAVPQAAPTPAPTAPEVEEPAEEEFVYQPSLLRDPFEPYIELEPERGGLEPLEQFELTEMQILGTISGIRDARAKIKAGGEFFTVRIGTLMGKNNGRVVAIRQGEIVVKERLRDERTGRYQYKDMCLRLTKEQGTVVQECQ